MADRTRVRVSEFLARARRKRIRTDSNIWGATHEAKGIWNSVNKGLRIVDPIMSVKFWESSVEIGCPEEVTIAFRAGLSRSSISPIGKRLWEASSLN